MQWTLVVPEDADLRRLQEMEMARERDEPPPPPPPPPQEQPPAAEAPARGHAVRPQPSRDEQQAGAQANIAFLLGAKEDAQGRPPPREELALLEQCVDQHERTLATHPGLPNITDICLRAFVVHNQLATGIELRVHRYAWGWSLAAPDDAEPRAVADGAAALKAGIMLRLAAEWTPRTIQIDSHARNRIERLTPRLDAAALDALSPMETSRLARYGASGWPVFADTMRLAHRLLAGRIMDAHLRATLPFGPAALSSHYADETRRFEPTPVAELERYARDMDALLNAEFPGTAIPQDDAARVARLRQLTETAVDAWFAVFIASRHALSPEGCLALLDRCIAMHERAFTPQEATEAMPHICLHAFALHASRATGARFSVAEEVRGWGIRVEGAPSGSHGDLVAATKACLMFRLAIACRRGREVNPSIMRDALEQTPASWKGLQLDPASFSPLERELLDRLGDAYPNWTWKFFSLAVREARQSLANQLLGTELDPHLPATLSGLATHYADATRPFEPTPIAELQRYATQMEALLQSEHDAGRPIAHRAETTLRAWHALWMARKESKQGMGPGEELDLLEQCIAMEKRAFGDGAREACPWMEGMHKRAARLRAQLDGLRR